ncbi:FAD binding domain-containing protein [Dactylonectria macrodidyma]|uniref:FAD binding domain-containing protein n=1 Tax=Dactylonectria macrodidyma TaxID=307937 RepID=A0A9P9JIQ6_9HYPO|nr:FAD binding domain-containing protein [Dactylonectria macrodidyma]
MNDTTGNAQTAPHAGFRAETPVLIIGGGPVGLSTAVFLSKYGIASTVVERQVSRADQPKAHVLNSRSLEIFKQMGISTDELRKRGASPSDADVVRFVQSLAGVEYGSMVYERQDEGILEFTPEPLVNVAQPEIEGVLGDMVKNNKLVTVWANHQWQSCTADGQDNGSRIVSIILDRASGKELTIRSKYLLACDGAHSRACAALGIPVETPASPFPSEVRYMSVELKADWRKFKSGILWMIMLKNSMRTFIAYDRDSHWVFAFMIDQDAPESQFTEEYCCEQVDSAVGEKVDYEILQIQVWTAYLRLADNYRSPKYPNAFLLGDAAHSFPPTGGLSLNTGIADVQNLVWKIHATESGWWDHDILETYSQERRPVAEMNSKQSDLNQYNILRVSTTIATAMDGNPASGQPTAESQSAVREVLGEVSDFRDNFNCQVGYVYGSDRPIKGNSKYYEHRAVIGGRLPHVYITKNGKRISTLDLVDGQGFAVIASSKELGLPSSFQVGKISAVVWQMGRHFQLDQDKESCFNFGDGNQFIVVRPDQHVAGFASSLEQVKSCLRGGGHV